VRKSGHANSRPVHAVSGVAASRSARVATANVAVNRSLSAKAVSR